MHFEIGTGRNGSQGGASVSVKSRLITAVISLTAVLLLSASPVTAGDSRGQNIQQVHSPDIGSLEGKWLRSDGGYVLEVIDVGADGSLEVAYFNPRQINVSKAEWRQIGERLQIFVQLRDLNYHGSSYVLIYLPAQDWLEGYYYQPLLRQNFEVVFTRQN